MNTYEEHVKTLCQPILLTIQTVSWIWEVFSGIVGILHRIVCVREVMKSNEKEEKSYLQLYKYKYTSYAYMILLFNCHKIPLLTMKHGIVN